MIRAVFFDLDGTLYDRDAEILQMAEEQFDVFREELGGIPKLRFVERLVELDSHGHNRTSQIHHVLAEELGFGSDVADGLESYFRANYHRKFNVSVDTRTTLETLRTRQIKLGIITNGPTEWQSRKVDALGIRAFFDSVLISEAEGFRKPDPRIFTRALDRSGIPASETMFVGDHPIADIEGAKAAGMLPVWKWMPYWEVADDVLQIRQLSEILPLVLR